MALKRRAPQRAATAWSFRLFSDKSKCLRLLGNACHKGDQASLEGPGDRMIVKDCMSSCSESSPGAELVLTTCGSEIIVTADSGASPSKSKRLISIPPSASSSASSVWTTSAATSDFPRIRPSTTKWWTSKGTESSLRLRVFATASRWTSSCAKHSSTSFTLHSEMPPHTCVVARENGNKALQSYTSQMNLPMASNGFKRYDGTTWNLQKIIGKLTSPLVLPPVPFAIPKHCGKRIGACPPSAKSFVAVGAEKGPIEQKDTILLLFVSISISSG